MSPQKTSSKAGYRNVIRRLLTNGFVAALLLLLILQCFVLGTGLTLTLPIPHFLFQKLTSGLAKQSIKVAAHAPTIDLTGRVALHNVEINSTHDSTMTSLRCDALYLGLDLSQLLFGRWDIDHLTLNNAALFNPQRDPDTEIQDPLLHSFSARIDRKGDLWHIGYFTLFIDNLHLSAHGEISKATPLPPSASPEQPTDSKKPLGKISQYLSVLSHPFEGAPRGPSPLAILSQQLSGFSPFLENLKNPELHLRFSHSENAPYAIEAYFQAESFHTPQDIYGGPFYALSRGNWRQSQPLQKIWLSAERVSLPLSDWIEPFLPTSVSDLSTSPNADAASPPHLSTQDAPSETLYFLNGHLTLSEGPILKGTLAAEVLGDCMKLHGDWDLLQKSGTLTLSGSLTPAELRLRPWASNIKFLERIELKGEPHIQFKTRIKTPASFDDIAFSAQALEAKIDGFEVQHFAASGTLTSPKLELHFGYHCSSSYKGSGTLTQNLYNKDYRLLFEGKLYPQSIDAWIHKDWWTKLWDDFHFQEDPPYVNIDLQGRWSDGKKTNLYTAVEGSAFTYRTLPLEHTQLNVYSTRGFHEISHLHAKRPEGTATANLRWSGPPDTQRIKHLDFSITSTLDPYKAIVVLKPDWQKALYPLTFTQSPQVKLEGRHYLPKSSKTTEGTASIKLETADRLYYNTVPLDCLFLEAIWKNPVIEFTHLDFDLADGRTEAAARLHYIDGQPHLDLEAQLMHADLPKFISILEGIDPDTHHHSTQDDSLTVKGALDLEIQVQGPYKQIENFEGRGSFILYSEELTTLYLLGPVSRLLKKTPLPIGAFKFNQAKATFILEDGRAYFPKLIINGPKASIESQGFYTLVDQTLGFQAKLFFMPDSGLSPLLSPLSHVLEFKISGDIDTADWHFQYSPLNLLNGNETPLMPMKFHQKNNTNEAL